MCVVVRGGATVWPVVGLDVSVFVKKSPTSLEFE
ncbi:hypothetical protein EGR_11035 [Echinococcus granulosus]|uniref:Uncharacterized protein n=1 Tax=Echinococcus granulosus TaxID=6210 RepID=W6U6V8_ECHGR|nr:hypothetical protein EGR_11035 [Echinococcus granulosus]EUB54107.1 hypothetical protein EGR_11035 [Echinococcus granulosus]